MSYSIQKRALPAQLVAYAEASAMLDEMTDVLGELFPKVMRHIQSEGGKVSGPPFTHYLSPTEPMDIQVGMPIEEPIADGDGVVTGELPGGEALITVHIGPYDQLDKAYDALMEEADEHGLQPTGTIWEVYWTDPGEEPDPDKWKTEVFMPLQG